MIKNEPQTNNQALVEALRRIDLFADLSTEQISWLAENSQEIRLAPGEILFREGEKAVYLYIYLEGELQYRRDREGPNAPIFNGVAGQVSGMLPYSRLTHFVGTSRAIAPSWIAAISAELFPEMLQKIPPLGQRLITVMADRIRESTRVDQQYQRLTALGKLSAGLAHELNNPATAGLRAAGNLIKTLHTLRESTIRLLRGCFSAPQQAALETFEKKVAASLICEKIYDPLLQSEREEMIATWLDNRQIENSWVMAGELAAAAVTIDDLRELSAEFQNDLLREILINVVMRTNADNLTHEIECATTRISELVSAIKEYSYLDKTPIQEIDIHSGIENTLTILGNCLKHGVKVTREFAPNLPKIMANGGELNQLWTNLIDNAIDAMQGKGEIIIRTSRELDYLLVEVIDNGPGIPPEVQPHIFEPFFTTKEIGKGTGLGLDIVYRIVRSHRGHINFTSRAGETHFQIRLPIEGTL